MHFPQTVFFLHFSVVKTRSLSSFLAHGGACPVLDQGLV
jgi:hypothetical protein